MYVHVRFFCTVQLQWMTTGTYFCSQESPKATHSSTIKKRCIIHHKIIWLQQNSSSVGGQLTVPNKLWGSDHQGLSLLPVHVLYSLWVCVCVCSTCCAMNQPHFGLLGKHAKGRKERLSCFHCSCFFFAKLHSLMKIRSSQAAGTPLHSSSFAARR